MSAVCCASPSTCPSRRHRDDGTLARLARPLIDDGQDLAHQAALRLVVLPAGEAFRHRIHVVDAALGIGGDHRVADRLQRHLRALLGLEHRGLGLLALGDVGDRAFEAVMRPCLSRTTRPLSTTTSMLPSLRRSTYSSLRTSPSLSMRRT